MLSRTSFKTPIGVLYLIADQQILLAAGFTGFEDLIPRLSPEDSIREIKLVTEIPVISELISDYFNGDTSALNSIKVRQPGAPFYQSVWKEMRKVPVGKTWSYSDLAKRAGSASAVRAVGSACSSNLIAAIVPCHRIVKSGGSLGNYAYGIEVKEWLLKHEGALQ
ncbi:MAG: methylated-DNA--[protein]-cysteine S-methyltransferase [Actinobacteria bacterium]|uniref:methylated-DNA--[protein]-cysteine S-methyltransferase n=1 Tax=freshwater metagenome TaxID=449393 RepID=A0A6J7TX50_9ZZZZ|nr:methylated-DNA--[protein]-cysteine S-methyltransferase [Actinomycetota bacterium]